MTIFKKLFTKKDTNNKLNYHESFLDMYDKIADLGIKADINNKSYDYQNGYDTAIHNILMMIAKNNLSLSEKIKKDYFNYLEAER